MNTVKVGVIGCGAISAAYFKGCAIYDHLEIVACADLDLERARARAQEFGIPQAFSVPDLLRDDSIELVINLTVPKAHAAVNRAILEAGKHAYVEKPFALDRDEAASVLALAAMKNLRVGCAPDTFLGGGIQTCRKLVDDGAIGKPIAATAFCCGHGHEHWHPSPQFYYQNGGGPLFDMGPYYLTALINFLGPARRVSASTRTTFATRTISSEPLKGTVIPVETPTHLAGNVDFVDGAIATVIMSFDVWAHTLPLLEIHGTEGSLRVPDPNRFDGEIFLKRATDSEWRAMPHTHSIETGRGTGAADMALALRTGRPHRASGELGAHVVDIMQAFDESSNQEQHIAICSTASRPAPVAAGLPAGRLE